MSHKESNGSELRDFILGGQDGLVNVLGIILGVATAVQDARIVIIAGIAATFAESISMGAVAYTSFKASKDFYRSHHIRSVEKPLRSAFIVGGSAIIGSLIPLIPFFLLPVSEAVPASVIISTAVLFMAGAVKAKLTLGRWWRSGLEMAAIGMTAAIAGYVVGSLLGVYV
jgi:VIT1/CCC1 family predicted Fe2+/Mn2+ transporter